MENIDFLTVACALGTFALLAGLAAMILVPMFVAGASIWSIVAPLRKQKDAEIQAERDELTKYKESIRESGGVMAPAVIIAAPVVKTRRTSSKYVDSYVINCTVDVAPEGETPFQANVQEEVFGAWHVKSGEMISKHGVKVWVVYDPKNKNRAYLDHYDNDHQNGLLEFRRSEFLRLTDSYSNIKKNGEQAQGVIVRAEDLDLPFPARNGRGVHFHIDVIPQSGPSFRVETDGVVTVTALEKYSAGKTVFVRFDPLDHNKAALDTERNSALK